MGHDPMNVTRTRHSSTVAAFAAALLLAFGFAVAQPGAAIAGVSDSAGSRAASSSGAIALPSERTKPAAGIVVADKKGWGDKGWKKGGGWGKPWKGNKVVVRPYKRWYKRPHYGRVIGGVALGTILGAAAYSAMAPAPNLCWYWADPYRSRGYWDYCY